MGKRRDNGTGTIYWDEARKRWRAEYFDDAGKRRKVSDPTQAGVRAKLRAATRSVEDGMPVAPARLTVGGWMDTWLAMCWARTQPGGPGKPMVAETVERYAEIVRLHLAPAVGRKHLGTLRYEDVVTALASIAAKPNVGPDRVRGCYKVLNTALEAAVKARKVPHNVCRWVDAPPSSPSRIVPWTATEAMAFVDAVQGHRLAPLLAFAVGSGARMGELRGLRWDDVVGLDTDAPAVTIRYQLTRAGELRGPKSKVRGVRTFRPTDLAAFGLRAQQLVQARERKAAGPQWQDAGYVFTQADGRPLDWRSLGRTFDRLQAHAGVRRQRFHDLRHAFATLMLEAGEELGNISKMLGHSDMATTVNVYAHLTETRTAMAADKFNRLLRPRVARAVAD